MSIFISYPDIIRAPLKINSLNSPKELLAHQSGKLIKILVKDNDSVRIKQPLAFIESTARHEDVIQFALKLNRLSEAVSNNKKIDNKTFQTQGLNLGELQSSVQAFYQEYILFLNTLKDGFYLTQQKYLNKELQEINKLRQQLILKKKVQEREYANVSEEYNAYKKLIKNGVISNSEFKQIENKYLAAKHPLQQTTTELLYNNTSNIDKQKEIASLESTINEQRVKFVQALNSLINETEVWMLKYIVFSTEEGKVKYVGILQENQNIVANQPLFIVNSGNSHFFGEVKIPQYKMGKVKVGQRSLVKLHSYPYEEFGLIYGRVSYVTDFALNDSVFLAKIELINFKKDNSPDGIHLKPGMLGDVEIVTKENSLFDKIFFNIMKMIAK
jgi:HlyD family secretion protein